MAIVNIHNIYAYYVNIIAVYGFFLAFKVVRFTPIELIRLQASSVMLEQGVEAAL